MNMMRFLKWAKYGAVIASVVCIVYVIDEFLTCRNWRVMLWCFLHAGVFAMLGQFFWLLPELIKCIRLTDED